MHILDIVVPFYNDISGIKKLISSIEQFSGFSKIIIVDDNSSGDIYEELKIISENYSYVNVFRNDSGFKGAGSCRNIGIEKSNAKWILFADSDDHFLDGAFNIVKQSMELDCDMVYFPPVSTDENGVLGHRHDTYMTYFEDYILHQNDGGLRYQLPVVWSRLFRAEFIKDNSIMFETTLVSNDRIFSLISGIKAKKISVSEMSIYSWDFNSSSLTTKMSKERFLINLEVFKRADFYLKKNLSKKDYIEFSESGMKFLAMSLLRYKYGVKFTAKVFLFLKKSHVSIIKKNDLKRLKNFFVNNKYYSS